MDQHLSFAQNGFAFIDEKLIPLFVKPHLNGLRTCTSSRSPERELNSLSGAGYLVWMTRIRRIWAFALDTKARTKSTFDSAYFRESFNLDDPERRFTDDDVKEWINIAKATETPPYSMLTMWLKKQHIFSSKNKKTINFTYLFCHIIIRFTSLV